MKSSRKQKFKLKNAPLILISPCTEVEGVEFGDASLSLSRAYQEAVLAAGGLPLVSPALESEELAAELVRRCDGVLMTGGDDINPEVYGVKPDAALEKTLYRDKGGRDLRELRLVDEIFKQKKPVFGICRGHQILNVALGGTMILDIPTQVPGAINHSRMDKKSEIVHEAVLTEGTMLASIAGTKRLGVNSTHHQALGRLAKALRATAVSEDGVVEATELSRECARMLPYFMTVQFHPERLAARHPAHQALFNHFVRACAEYRKSKL
jgi:putative glutamine amidotransferase